MMGEFAMPEKYRAFRTEKSGRIFWIFLNNPEKRNAMGMDFWNEISQVFAEADADSESRAIVLAAEGKAFCAGLDLMALTMELPMLMGGEPGGKSKKQFLEVIRRYQQKTNMPENCRKPVIAAVHGNCIGGGLDLIAACDIRLAAEDASFSLREAAVAMIADLGSLQRLPHIIGEGWTRQMAYTAENVSAGKALEIGLVNAVYPDREALLKATAELAERIADNSPLAVETSKEVLNWGRGRTIADGLEYAAHKQVQLLPNPDLMEAVGAFMERRKPEFGKK